MYDALVQALHGNLVGQLLAKLHKAASAFNLGLQLCDRDLVLLGHGVDRLIDIGVGDVNALILGFLYLQAHQYQTVEYLLAQNVGWR